MKAEQIKTCQKSLVSVLVYLFCLLIHISIPTNILNISIKNRQGSPQRNQEAYKWCGLPEIYIITMLTYRRLNKIEKLWVFIKKKQTIHIHTHTHTQTRTKTNTSTIRKYDKEEDLVLKKCFELGLKKGDARSSFNARIWLIK